MISFVTRYKIIKDNANLSGRGALNQWQYYNVMDDMLARDPAIIPLVVETTNGMSYVVIEVFLFCFKCFYKYDMVMKLYWPLTYF